jgi:hypothetical protein
VITMAAASLWSTVEPASSSMLRSAQRASLTLETSHGSVQWMFTTP